MRILVFDPTGKNKKSIDLTALRSSSEKQLNNVGGLIDSATEEYEQIVVKEHDAQPIKDIETINEITEFLKASQRWRDNMLFIVGINFGLRYSDLSHLRFADLIDENFTFKDTFPVFEIKTRNTRKKKINRYITINRAVKEAVIAYLEHTPNIALSDYLFRSEATNQEGLNYPLTTRSANRIFEGIKKDLNLGFRFSTHTLRKTFCYHQMVMSDNDPRKLMLLQKMLGHSSILQTLTYIGITEEEIHDAYKNLNLGSEYNYLMDTKIIEKEEVS